MNRKSAGPSGTIGIGAGAGAGDDRTAGAAGCETFRRFARGLKPDFAATDFEGLGRTGPAFLWAAGLPGFGLRNAMISLCRSREGASAGGSSPVLLFGRLAEDTTTVRDNKFYLQPKRTAVSLGAREGGCLEAQRWRIWPSLCWNSAASHRWSHCLASPTFQMRIPPKIVGLQLCSTRFPWSSTY